jgi:hypothetical protein
MRIKVKKISIWILIIVIGVLALYQVCVVVLFSRVFKQDPRQLALLEINGIKYEVWYTPEGAYNRAMLNTRVNGHEYHFCQYSLPSPPGDSLVSLSNIYIKKDTLHIHVNLIEKVVLFKFPVLYSQQNNSLQESE